MTYAVASLSVDRRMEELALLRAAGMSGSAVGRLVVIDTLLLALPATLLGVVAATYLSDSLVAIFSRASAYLQHAPIERVQMRWTTVGVAVAVGLGVALLASIEPALRAASRSPLDVLRSHRLPASPLRSSRRLVALAIGAALLAGLAFGVGDRIPDTLRVVLTVLFGAVFAGAAMSQLFVRGFPWIERLLHLVLPRIGCLVGAALAERPIETGVTIALWAAGVGGLLALLSMTHGIAVSIDDFRVDMSGPDGVLVLAEDPAASYDRELIRRDVVEKIRRAPGVLDLAEHYATTVTWRGEEVPLWSFPTRARVRHATDLRVLADDPAATVAAFLRGELAMNAAFARHFGAKVGDMVEIATWDGPRSFRIGGFARSYAGPTGALLLDVEAFERWLRPQGSPWLWLWTAEPRDEVLRGIHERVRDQALFLLEGEAFRRQTALLLERFDDLAMVPISMIGTIGAVALASLLLGSVVARRRDIALIRAAGANTRDVAGLVVVQAVVIGFVGIACGLALGAVWTQVVTDATAQSLGFEVQYHLNGPAAVALAAGAIVLSLASGIAPALMSRVQVSRSIKGIR